MDDVLNFFDKNKPIRRKIISGGTTNRLLHERPTTSTNQQNNCAISSNFADTHIKANNDQLIRRFDESNSDEENHNNDSMDDIFCTYNFNRPTSKCDLPITHYKDKILNAIKENPFVVLEGPTACGKTTQVPQFILDEAYNEKKYCNIVVAQPRRIAASSNAERVANERSWQLGTIIGYQVGFDENKFKSGDTRILYCTTGILLQKLIHKKNFGSYTHIILDEVHERNKEMDFLFVIIKKLFVSTHPRPKIKIIIMSATIQASRFSEYFTFPRRGILESAPIITVERKMKFQIEEYYLDQFYTVAPKIEISNLDRNNPTIAPDLYRIALNLINRFDTFDQKELAAQFDSRERPTVLVFLPGINEIIEMETVIKDQWINVNKNKTRIEIIVLHSTSSAQQRCLAFRKAGPRIRKVILATNIAESSITVPDVKYVLDFCRTRIMLTDSQTKFSALQLSWAARSSCKQRAGRTGRVMDGQCFRFVEKHFYDTVMEENAIPELVSSPLENVILNAKLLEMGSPESILALAMDYPNLDDIANTILVLKEIGALLKTCNGKVDDMDGDISFIGRIMANLPLDVRISKFIILGYCFSVLEECIIIGAALNSRSIFRDGYTNKDSMRLYSHQLRWANKSGSDLIAMLIAYNAWVFACSNQRFGVANDRAARERMKHAERQWANKYCLDIDALHECYVQVNEIKNRLKQMNIEPSTGIDSIRWNDNEKAIILKVVIAGGFYPNYFARTSLSSDQYEREALRILGTRDPRNTVYYTGFDRDYIRCLYTENLKKIFIENNVISPESAANLQIIFDPGSNKTFVTFKNTSNANYCSKYGTELMPGKICTEVYKAIKMQQLRIPSVLWIMRSPDEEIKYAKRTGITLTDNGHGFTNFKNIDIESYCFPRILDVVMTGYITNVETCSSFWFQPEEERDKVIEFETYIQNYRREVIELLPKNALLSTTSAVIVKVEACQGTMYHRAKILSATNDVCQVRLIDYGKVHDTSNENVYNYCGKQRKFIDLPPRCFECGLAQLQPSLVQYPDGFWPHEAIELFKEKTDLKLVNIEVFSVTNGKANVFIHCPDETESMNDILIHANYAEYINEDYISNYNHLSRKSQFDCQAASSKIDNFVDPMTKDYLMEENVIHIDPPPAAMCKTKLNLKGPYSPLSIECYGLSKAARGTKIKIDRHSVNSVMLENDPQDLSEKYLVAATVCNSDANQRSLNLRSTTQMPNIRGFAPLMALCFCPTMQVKCNQEKTHYTAIRTGLGYDSEKNRPMFEKHDIVFNLDVEITQHDIDCVNQIRYCLDTLLLTNLGDQTSYDLKTSNKKELLHSVKTCIVKLLAKPRQCINREMSEFDWNPHFADSDGFIKSCLSEIYGDRAIFPIHNTLKTESTSDADQNFKRLHCSELHHIAQFMSSLPKSVKCKLCNVKIHDIAELKMHLLSRLHVDNEKRIGFEN